MVPILVILGLMVRYIKANGMMDSNMGLVCL